MPKTELIDRERKRTVVERPAINKRTFLKFFREIRRRCRRPRHAVRLQIQLIEFSPFDSVRIAPLLFADVLKRHGLECGLVRRTAPRSKRKKWIVLGDEVISLLEPCFLGAIDEMKIVEMLALRRNSVRQL